jgi:Galactose oxidase, central domain
MTQSARIILLVGTIWTIWLTTGTLWSAEPSKSTITVTLEDAPVNTWVKVCESATGGRKLPIFVYAPTIKKFILTSGMQTSRQRHYDTEEFDLASNAWVNAYPVPLVAGRPNSGPVGKGYSKRVSSGKFNNRKLLYADGDFLRVGAGAPHLLTRFNYEFTVVPETGKIYAYMQGKTICYDVAKRTWKNLGAKPRGSCQIWGSLCYDPVNKEILHSGGDGASWDIGTWVYGIKSNAWRKLKFGSTKVKALGKLAKQLRWQAKALLGACCNRFAVSETEAESKADLVVQAKALVAAAERLANEIKTAGLSGAEKTAGGVAVKRLKAAGAALKLSGPKLTGKINPNKIAAIRSIRVIFEQVVDALATEPPGRARSQSAYDSVHKKIVLFGGDQLDRVLSDTWLYDCATRTWEQRFPEQCPSPRAGHVLAWLPKSGKIVLAGGYSEYNRETLPQEIWCYDVSGNTWTLLRHMPLSGVQTKHSVPEDSPNATLGGVQFGAVNENDVLVCPSVPSRKKTAALVTWACKIDTSKSDSAGTAARASTSGSYAFNSIDPAIWEAAAKPEPKKTRQFLDGLPANQWTAFQLQKYAPGGRGRWGTAAYDTKRQQFLFWGGGHSTSRENDVSHFSVHTGLWTVGYHPDRPIEWIYATVPTPFSFNDRPQVPMHAYHSYAYDPRADKMLYLDRGYNLVAREWESIGLSGLPPIKECQSLLISTPHGVVLFSKHPPLIFDAKASRWKALPWKGELPKFGSCDQGGGTYDYKRDCLWVSTTNGFFRYDFKTGTGNVVKNVKPRFNIYGAKLVFVREVVHVPDPDLILIWSGGGGKGPVQNGVATSLAWSPKDKKYYWVELPAMADGKPVAKFGYDASDGLVYDPELKLVLLNKNYHARVYALKLDRTTLKMTEIAE